MKYKDEKTGFPYWHNTATSEVQWEVLHLYHGSIMGGLAPAEYHEQRGMAEYHEQRGMAEYHEQRGMALGLGLRIAGTEDQGVLADPSLP